MSGLVDKQGSSKQFFKLQEDKRDASKTKGQYRFFQQEKVNGAWASTNEGNSMSGIVKSINVKSYKWQDQDKENVELELMGQDGSIYVISFGFNTMLNENLINTLASEPIIGEIELSCGAVNQQGYPTFYIKHDGQKTKWKYSKENSNWDEIPKITTEVIEGQKIKRGAAKRTEFWKKVLNEQILPKLKDVSIKDKVMAKNEAQASSTIDTESDLPF
jgi:hypothetical protein